MAYKRYLDLHLSGRAAGMPALEMIRAMLLCVEHRGAGLSRLSTEPHARKLLNTILQFRTTTAPP
ncbi:hypothetical protein HZB03_01155 [Candidatus Woesearchaeota archaeon]|nr:hypothetical protein [Candidatus Woesearchaeota archaeon]